MQGRRAGRAVILTLGALLLAGGLQAEEPRRIALEVVAGQISGPDLEPGPGAPVLRVRQGERLRLEVASDQALELHLHGYDLLAQPVPGAAATLALDARAAGRFPLTVHGDGPHHHHHAVLLYLEVHPR